MGLDAYLLDYDGAQLQVVGDPKSTLHRALRESNLADTICLRFIDLFGRTTFNRAQAAVLASELASLKTSFPPDAKAHVDRLQHLLDLLERRKGYELQFQGD